MDQAANFKNETVNHQTILIRTRETFKPDEQ